MGRERTLVGRGTSRAMGLFVCGPQQLLDFILQVHSHVRVQIRVYQDRQPARRRLCPLRA